MTNKVEIVGDSTTCQTNQAGVIQLHEWHYFPSIVYSVHKPEFLTNLNKVAKEYVNKIKKKTKLDEIYPVHMSENMYMDSRIIEFNNFIGYLAKDILTRQGYNMSLYNMVINEMWTQEHYKFSGQEEHVHPWSQISGFYFLEVPKKAPRTIIHDPRPAKVFSNLPETDPSQATPASTMINFEPTAGTLMMTNSWLPHSFTKNPSDKPFRFIHFNMGVTPIQSTTNIV